MVRTKKIFLVVFLAATILAAWWFFNRLDDALCAKYARVWMRDIKHLAGVIEGYHESEGTYPVAFDDVGALREQLGDDLPRIWSTLDDGPLKYFSDGQRYLIVLEPSTPGPRPRSAYSFMLKDGEWISWPECVPSDQYERLFREITPWDLESSGDAI